MKVDLSLFLFRLKEVANPMFLQRGRTALYFKMKELLTDLESDEEYMDACARELDKCRFIKPEAKDEIRKALIMKSPEFRAALNAQAAKSENEQVKKLKDYAKNLFGAFRKE